MGKSITPKYRVETVSASCTHGMTPFAWDGKRDGRATQANLEKFVATMNASMKPGKANAHLEGMGLEITAAKLIRQSDGEVVAEFSDEVDVDAEANSNYLKSLGV